MNDLEEIVNREYIVKSDINEHIPTLVKYASECEPRDQRNFGYFFTIE